LIRGYGDRLVVRIKVKEGERFTAVGQLLSPDLPGAVLVGDSIALANEWILVHGQQSSMFGYVHPRSVRPFSLIARAVSWIAYSLTPSE
jgi:hypothetical protein